MQAPADRAAPADRRRAHMEFASAVAMHGEILAIGQGDGSSLRSPPGGGPAEHAVGVHRADRLHAKAPATGNDGQVLLDGRGAGGIARPEEAVAELKQLVQPLDEVEGAKQSLLDRLRHRRGAFERGEFDRLLLASQVGGIAPVQQQDGKRPGRERARPRSEVPLTPRPARLGAGGAGQHAGAGNNRDRGARTSEIRLFGEFRSPASPRGQRRRRNAPGEIRTPTPFRASDFESPASTVPPRGPIPGARRLAGRPTRPSGPSV